MLSIFPALFVLIIRANIADHVPELLWFLTYINIFNHHYSSGTRYLYCLHFTHEETEAQSQLTHGQLSQD